jgi:methyl-accepting chemotaxis protein
MHPNGLFLLTVGLCSFAVVCVAAGFLAVKAWRLLKRGIRISRVAGPLAADLAMRAEQLAKLSDDMAHQTEQVVASTDRLAASTRRLQVVLQAFSDGLAPYRRVRDYFGM